MEFKPNLDGILASRRFAGMGSFAALSLLALVTGEAAGLPWLAAAAVPLAAGAALCAWAAFDTRCTIRPLELVVCYGPFRRRVPLECIEGVAPAERRVIGPSRTVAMLSLAYSSRGRPRMVHLAVDDPSAFLVALVDAAPFLERRGDRVVRTPGLLTTEPR